MFNGKDLLKEPPRSPRARIGGYSILVRMIDKGRAVLNGTVGEYEYNCGLDQMLFSFKGIDHEEVKRFLANVGMADQFSGKSRNVERNGLVHQRQFPPEVIRTAKLLFYLIVWCILLLWYCGND